MRPICIGCGHRIMRYSIVKRYKGNVVHAECLPKRPASRGSFVSLVHREPSGKYVATVNHIALLSTEQLRAFANRVLQLATWMEFRERLYHANHPAKRNAPKARGKARQR